MVAGGNNNSSASQQNELVSSWNLGWTLAYSVAVLLVCISNPLVIVAFTRTTLRKRAHYNVINLATADLAVGILVMPFYMLQQIMTFSTPKLAQHVLYFGDIFFGLASFFVLTMISCERLYAIAWPFRHRSLQARHYAISLATPWFMAGALAVSDRLWEDSIPFAVPIPFISMGLVVMISCYVTLWLKTRVRPQRQNRQRKLAKTLFITTVASLLTWMPIQLYMFSFSVCGTCPTPSHHVAFAIKFVQFSNSFINVIIYSFRIPEFRGTVRQLFIKESSEARERQERTRLYELKTTQRSNTNVQRHMSSKV